MSDKINEVLIDESAINNNDKKTSGKTKEVNKKSDTPVSNSVKPVLFFKKDTKIEISIDGYHSKETGVLQFVLLNENNNDNKEIDELFNKVNYKFWFTRVPYDRLNRYRNNSMIYNSEDQNNTINELKLREFFLVYHLIDWNLTDEDGKKIEVKFDPNAALSDESLNLIYQLPSILIDNVLMAFERKMAIA